MGHSRSRISATGLGWLLAAAFAAASEGPQVVNPGFEQLRADGTVVGWTVEHGSIAGSPAVEGVTEEAFAGVGSLRISLGGHGAATVVSDPVRLEVGRLYRLGAAVRTEGAFSDPTARYPTAVPAVMTMASFPFTNHSPAVGGTREWTAVETLFLATRAEDRIRLHLGFNGTARGTAWFDEVRLEAVEDISQLIPLDGVRWAGRGFRFDDRGWIFLHLEGAPHERGYQHGALVADEIIAYMGKLGVRANGHDPAAGWARLRFEADALFLRGFDREYLEEMRGIADGATAAGARWEGREIDLRDIVTLNSVVDLGQLEDAVEVTPHALTGEGFLGASEEIAIGPDRHRCSAFAATGPATRSGEVVFGQIFMWDGYTGVHWNVIADLVPSSGHRLAYHTFPGGIHSGADFYVNGAGIVIGETTVAQTPFESAGTPQSNRIRKAAQYASTIDEVVELLWDGNNGMYTNDWPIADVKTGEVAILLLGTHAKKLWRTSEDPAPFGLPGFLWANNNNRDPAVRREYLAQPDDRPFDVVFSPWNRDVAFTDFYREHAGRIDDTAAVELWASSPVNRAHACDGKITTSEMARELVFLAHFGKVTLRSKFPTPGWRYLPDLPGAEPHLSLGYSVVSPKVVADGLAAARADASPSSPAEQPPELEPGDLAAELTVAERELWRRTVLPATEADNWFPSASAAYWKLLHDLPEDPVEAAGSQADALAALTASYLYTVSREPELAARDAHRAYDRYGPYRIPRIKGTFALHQLRLHLGTARFLEMMRAVHERFAGREATTEEILAVAARTAGTPVAELVRPWLDRTGLPAVTPSVELRRVKDRWQLDVELRQDGEPYPLVTHLAIDVGGRRELHRVSLTGALTELTLPFDERPTRVEVDPLRDLPVDRRELYTWANFIDDFHRTLIVYGTSRQAEANRTLAERWQRTVADAYVEILPPLVKDCELDDERAAGHDLMVLGSAPDNAWLERHAGGLPVELGRNLFRWRGRTYAEPDDGLVLVLANPLDPDRVLYLVIANSALQLHRMTESYRRDLPQWARFEGGVVVERGWHEPEGYVIELDPGR